MSSRCRNRALLFLVLAAFCAAPAQAEERAFRICAEPDNLPLSHRDGGGFEIEVGRLLAEELKRPFEVVWATQRTHGFIRATIGADKCDAMMSVPAGFDRLATTRPWYRSSFMIVGRKDGPKVSGFDDPQLAALTIGVPMIADGQGAPPAAALTRRGLAANLRAYSAYEPAALIAAVSEGKIDLAILWGPFAAWHVAARDNVKTATLPVRDGAIPMAFELAIGVQKGNPALRDEINVALDRRQQDIASILARWRVVQE